MDQMNDIMAKLVNKKHNKSKLKISLTLAKKIMRRALKHLLTLSALRVLT